MCVHVIHGICQVGAKGRGRERTLGGFPHWWREGVTGAGIGAGTLYVCLIVLLKLLRQATH